MTEPKKPRKLVNKTYRQRRKAGLCVSCKSKAVDGRSMCAACQIKSRVSQKAHNQKRKELGLCIRGGCKELRQLGRSFCAKHLIESRDLMAKRNQESIEKGVCIRCRKEPPKAGLKMCVTCYDRNKNDRAAKTMQLKQVALETYGGAGGAECCGCRETDTSKLQVDHIDLSKKPIRELDGLYTWLNRLSYPMGFCVRCPKCMKRVRQQKAISRHPPLKIEEA